MVMYGELIVAIWGPVHRNKKTPVISRSSFINQKTNSHDNCC